MLFAAAAAAGHTVGAGEGPLGAPSNASAFPYGGGLVGVQWTNGDATAVTQVALTGGADPTASDVVATAAAGATTYESGTTTQGFWFVRHAKNGQFSSWTVAYFVDEGGGEVSQTPAIDSVTQTTDPDACSVGQDVNLRIRVTMVGSSQGTLQEQVDGGSWTTVDSSVAAGATQLTRTVASGSSYAYRLRYNDVSPANWSAASAAVSATCNLL